MSSSIVYRSVKKGEEYHVIDLWKNCFPPKSDGYFERYFSNNSSPEYIEGDTLGAWDENCLISVVHIRRMYFKSNQNNEKYLCGVISNVSTLPEYRHRGLSRQLLQYAIEKMKNENFHISMLGTGQPNHYIPLGYQTLTMSIEYLIEISDDHPSSSEINPSWISTNSINNYEELFEIYSNNPREYQYDRWNSSMFQHWIGWHWNENNSLILIVSNGYIVLSQPDGKGSDMSISEWRAADEEIERFLLQMAAREIHRKNFFLHTLPQHTTLQTLQWNNKNSICEQNEDILIRNIQLDEQIFADLQQSYQSTLRNAIIWPGEYF